jgi:hypothetical protein
MMQTDQWSQLHFTGTKINKVRWLPRFDQIGRASFFTTGTWEQEASPPLHFQINSDLFVSFSQLFASRFVPIAGEQGHTLAS